MYHNMAIYRYIVASLVLIHFLQRISKNLTMTNELYISPAMADPTIYSNHSYIPLAIGTNT